MVSEAQLALDELVEGNRRFRTGQSLHHRYSRPEIEELSRAPEPKVAVIACADSRVSPEIVFDQPLGTLFVSRVPGNVAANSVKWMTELAVELLKVPLLLVVGHTKCLAVKQVVEGVGSRAGMSVRSMIATAVLRAKAKRPENLFRQAIAENALMTAEALRSESAALQHALQEGRTALKVGVYDVVTGEFGLLGE